MNNAYIKRWAGKERELEAALAVEGPKYDAAVADGDTKNATVTFGENVGLIHSVEPAAVIIERMIDEAARTIQTASRLVASL